jgi:hypothetical protein
MQRTLCEIPTNHKNQRKKEYILGTIESRLENLGINLPAASNPAASYTNFVIVNGLMFVSGKGPSGNPKGKLGSNYTTEDGYTFARQTGIEVLAVLKEGRIHARPVFGAVSVRDNLPIIVDSIFEVEE